MAASMGMRILLTQNLNFKRSSCCLCRRGQHYVAATQPGPQPDRSIPRGQVSIPKKKKRDSLSILKALASTVGSDATAEHYQYMDDPELITAFRTDKKLMMLSKASGQRAAQFIVNEYKNTFNHDGAAPHIEAFHAHCTEYQHTAVCQEALVERISCREVMHATEVYDKMKQQGLEVSRETQLSFLELLCVFNCTDLPSKLLPLEMWFGDHIGEDEKAQNWKTGNKAEQVFDELPEKTADAYNWMVQGAMKHRNAQQGLVYYSDMCEKNIPVRLGTYNWLLRSNWGIGRADERWARMKELLETMKREGFPPNLDTFHSVLNGFSGFGIYIRHVFPQIIAEMKALGFEPTLQTWNLVLLCLRINLPQQKLHNERGNFIIQDIREIVEYLKNADDEVFMDIGSARDNFFLTAMRECESAFDPDTALLLFNFKEELGIRYIVTDLPTENNFNNSLMRTLLKTETCDTVMNFFRKIRSSLWPYFRLYMELLDLIDTYQEYHHLLEVWDEYQSTEKLQIKNLEMYRFFSLMSQKTLPLKLKSDFALIAETVYKKLMKSYNARFGKPMFMDGVLLGYIMQVFINNQNVDMAWKCMLFYSANVNDLLGNMSEEAIADLFNCLIDNKDTEKLVNFGRIYGTISDGTLYKLVEARREDLESLLPESEMIILDSL